MPYAPTEVAESLTAAPRFTRKRANAALIYVRPIVTDITRVYRRVVEVRERLAVAAPADLVELEAAYDAAMTRLGGLVDELQSAGVELRDFEEGVVAFRGRVRGEDASLIWRITDPATDAHPDRVTHFVRPGGTISQLQPLP
jgi:hypothetical protein